MVRGLLIVVASRCGSTGFSSCGPRALEHRLSSCGAFVATAPPRKSVSGKFKVILAAIVKSLV